MSNEISKGEKTFYKYIIVFMELIGIITTSILLTFAFNTDVDSVAILFGVSTSFVTILITSIVAYANKIYNGDLE